MNPRARVEIYAGGSTPVYTSPWIEVKAADRLANQKREEASSRGWRHDVRVVLEKAGAGRTRGVVALGAMQLTPKERMALAEARHSGSVRSGHVHSKRTLASLTDKGYLRLTFAGYETSTYEPIS
jgi:hypothetical protein